jgi:hypothetical protein
MSIPIVTIHLADREHLGWVLAQAKHSNPKSNIFLIGDPSSNHYRFIEHEDIGNYFQEAQEFQKIYRHLSRNSLSYELLCFQRWFVLKKFMESQKIEKCLCIDSDVMLYAPLEEEQKKIADFDWALYNKWVPHCVFVNNLRILDEFCRFLIELYTNSSKLEILESEYKNSPTGKVVNICDMTAFRKFYRLNSSKIGDLSKIINDSTYDKNINRSEGFEMYNGIKNIFFIEKQPFGRHLELNKEIKFNAIHFQGYAKVHVKDYFTGELSLKEIISWGSQAPKNKTQGNQRSGENNCNSDFKREKPEKRYVVIPLKVGEINFIIFPDWSDPEHSLCRDLEKVIRAIATHPDTSKITLLVDLGNISREEANLVLSGIILNLFMQEDLEIREEPDISLVGQLDEMQWKALLNLIQARIRLEKENKQAIAAVKAETLPVYELDSLLPTR